MERWMGRNHIFLCREYTISRAFKESEVRLAIFTGTLIGPVGEVHIVETHGENGIEVGVLFNTNPVGHIFRCDIPSDWTLRGTSFINSEESSGPVMNCSRRVQRRKGVRYEEREVPTSHKETWAAPSPWKQDADPNHHTQESGTPVYEVSHSSKWKKWITIPANYRRWSHLATMIRDKLRQCVVTLWSWEECQEKVCIGWSARFQWWRVSQQVLEGSTMNRIDFNKDKDGFIYVIYELFKDTREVSQSIQI